MSQMWKAVNSLYRPAFDKGKILQDNLILMAKCISKPIETEGIVRVDRLILDERLNYYFRKYADVNVYDPQKHTKKGDIVLIRRMEKPLTLQINYEIEKIVYKLGDITDPITGRKCVNARYRDEEKQIHDIYGYAYDNTPFDYDKAPDRGWQEGRKDFSHNDPYQKFHEFEKGHPKHNDKTAYWNKTLV